MCRCAADWLTRLTFLATSTCHTQNPNVSLLKLEGVENREGAEFYLGKRVAFVYRARKAVKGTKTRVVWGKVVRSHGNSGVVRARFVKNLNPRWMGATVRVMLYPSNI